MISIVIPVFNVERHLHKCLNSVINQTYRDLEILLVNDGSTDSSKLICLEYAAKDDRIIYVQKKNEGLGSVRNLGIAMAQGEYFTTLDSDDWWDLTFCEKMLSAAEKFDADITLCDFMNVEMDGEKMLSQSPSRMRVSPDRVHRVQEEPALLNTCRTVFGSKLYKTSFLKSTHINQPHFPFEDMATTPLLTVLADKIVRVPETLLYYLRNRADSITNLPHTKRYLIQALTLLVKRFQGHGLFGQYQQELMKKNHSDVRFVLSRMNQPGEEEERKNIKAELCAFLTNTYPQWINVSEYSFTVIGSNRLLTAVQRFLFEPERARYFPSIEAAIDSPGAVQSDYLLIDSQAGLERLPPLPSTTRLFLIGDAASINIESHSSAIVRLSLPNDAEDEDCACWDLSDAIFFAL